MNLYRIFQNVNIGYDDTHLEFLVAAENEFDAVGIRPIKFSNEWCHLNVDVQVKYLGVAKEGTKKGIIISSFNAS